MKENKKDVEVIEETEVENVQSEETKKENIFTKGANFVKRNGKKIGAGVLIGAGLLAAYAFGKRSVVGSEDYDEADDSEESDYDPEDSTTETE